jgi:biopolymer transport protein ExbB/TolQ
MLGIVGTMISLSNAMMQVDISQGVQVAINNMTALTGQALNSSIYGIVLALVAYMMKSFCKRKWEE